MALRAAAYSERVGVVAAPINSAVHRAKCGNHIPIFDPTSLLARNHPRAFGAHLELFSNNKGGGFMKQSDCLAAAAKPALAAAARGGLTRGHSIQPVIF